MVSLGYKLARHFNVYIEKKYCTLLPPEAYLIAF